MTIQRHGGWNLRVGRPPERVVDEVQHFVNEHEIDVLHVCEGAGYQATLRANLDGYRVIGYPLDRGLPAADSYLIVRKGVASRWKRLHWLERTGWERKPGRAGLHTPRSTMSALIDHAYRSVPVHLPPGPDGPTFPMRRRARVNSLATIEQLGTRWNRRGRAWVMAGDWNYVSSAPRVVALARRLDADICGHGIDWVMSHGVKVDRYRKVEFGTSDHDPFLFRVTKESR